MRSLGMYFRELRLAKGLSLEEVASITRVSQRYLEALEADALDKLPAPVFTKGFIRAYCQALGEPPDEALLQYRDLTGEATTPALPVASARPIESRGPSPVVISLALLIVLGLGLFALTLTLQERTGNVAIQAPPPAYPQRELSAPAPTPPAASVSEETARPAVPAGGGLVRLVARANEPTWISVRTDAGQVVEELLPAGAIREWTSAKRFILTIGNAGGVALELNGHPLPPLGARGAVIRELVLPREEGSKP